MEKNKKIEILIFKNQKNNLILNNNVFRNIYS
jgi:hypothetical protein